MRTHNRDHFYKFMTVKAALASLGTSSLRYSAPSRFNDPFDHQVQFTFPYTQSEFASALLAGMERVIYDDAVVLKETTKLGQACIELKGIRGRVLKDKLLAELQIGADGSASRFKDLEEDFNTQFTAYISHSRVLCVTEEIDNVVMWSHYAEEHKGVAIRLECIEEVDNTLLMAKPVKYVDSFPPFPSPADYVKHLTGEAPIDFAAMVYSEAVYIKHQHWGYEKEWRVHVPLMDEPAGAGYSDWPENPRVFGAVYLGCRISTEDAQSLLSVIEEKMPHLEVHQASKCRTRFGIEFERLR